MSYLRSVSYDPYEEPVKRWNRSLGDVLGDEYEFLRPNMPGGNNDYEAWSIWFERQFSFLRDNVVLVGHSLGANFLAAYLAEHAMTVSISLLHLVAGCAGEGTFPFPESGENIEKQAKNIFIYHSHDDPVVPFADAEKYQTLLPNATLVALDGRGHFLGEEFPELVEKIRGV